MAMLGNPLSTMDFPCDYFTGDGTSTTFQLSRIPASATSILVHIGGVKQVASTTDPAYYLDGSKLVFVSPPGAYSPIEVNYLGIAGQVNIPGVQSVTQDMLSLQLANTFVYQTTANGATASFTLNAPPVSANSLVVSANGVVQYDYSVNGTNLTFGFTPPVGTFIRITSLALAQAGVPADGSVTSVKLGANLTITGNTTFDGFSGAGARIRGDFINATLANRVYFQSSSAAGTDVGVLPNLSSGQGQFSAHNSSDVANANKITLIANSTETSLRSNINGTASYLPLTMYTGGSERMRIDTSGNVGIGVTPSAWSGFRALQVGSTTSIWSGLTGNTSSFYTNNGFFNGSNRIYLTNGLASEYIQGQGLHIWYTAASGTAGNPISFSESMRIDSSGNVGIGTNNPATKAEISGTAAAQNLALRITNTATDGYSTLQLGDANAGVYRNGSAQSGYAGASSLNLITVGAHNIGFSTQNTLRAVIDSSGNMGIGISSPAGKLHVMKTATGGSPQNPAGNQIVIENGDSSGSADLQFLSATNGYNHIFFGDAGDANVGVLLYDHNNNSFQFATNAAERMRLTSGGSLGLGTTSPVSGLEIYRANSTTGSLTDTSLMLSTSATTGRKVNIGFGLGGGVANTLAATIGYDVTNGAGAGLGDIFFCTRNTTADSVPTERMRITSAGTVLIGNTARASGASGSNPRLIVGNDTNNGGFGEFFTTTQSGTKSFSVVNSTAYRVTIISSVSSASAKFGQYIFYGLNKGAGNNPAILTVATSGPPDWTFSYALLNTNDTTVTVTDGGNNQGTKIYVEQLGGA